MAQAVEPERGARSVSFEVERFELRGQGRVALSGRWFGLRGRRFVRPTLTLGTGASRRQALADLEHKPWAADDGELWEAAFPIERDGGDLSRIELTVAPDITVALPPPGTGASDQRIRARPRRDDLLNNLRGARRDGRPAPGSSNGSDPRRRGRSAPRWEDGPEAPREESRAPQAPPPSPSAKPSRQNGEAPGLAQRLSDAQREIERLRAELARHQAAARDQAMRARDQAARAQDQALRERDRMAKQREQALRERDRAIAKANKLSESAAARPDHRSPAAHPAVARPAVLWTQRVLAVSVLLIAVLAFAITARLV